MFKLHALITTVLIHVHVKLVTVVTARIAPVRNKISDLHVSACCALESAFMNLCKFYRYQRVQ